MEIKLTITSGPHRGKEFVFDGHDTFLVGRTKDAHLQFPVGDPYFSRRHFVVEVNPPRCRVMDLNSRNGTLLNGVAFRPPGSGMGTRSARATPCSKFR